MNSISETEEAKDVILGTIPFGSIPHEEVLYDSEMFINNYKRTMGKKYTDYVSQKKIALDISRNLRSTYYSKCMLELKHCMSRDIVDRIVKQVKILEKIETRCSKDTLCKKCIGKINSLVQGWSSSKTM